MRVRWLDVVCALAFTVAVTAAAFARWYEPPQPEPVQPVARVTTSDLELIADLLRTLDSRPGLTPAERATVDRVAEAVEDVNAGVVEVIPEADPLPPATTTTTTTTGVPLTTSPPPSTIPYVPWPTVTTPDD